MAETLRLEIVTPEGIAFSEDVEMVTLDGVEGQMGIYPQHMQLMTALAPGEMILVKGGRESFIANGIGVVVVTGNRVEVLTDLAVASDKLDEAKAEEARQRAAARLQEKIADEEVASINASLVRSLAQLKTRRRRHV